MVRALVLTQEVTSRIDEVRRFAEDNPLSLYQIKKIIEGVSPPPGDDDRFVCLVPNGYRCVFAVETHRNDTTVRHLSISVDSPGNYPNPHAVDALMPMFGFEGKMRDVLVRIDERAESIDLIEEITSSGHASSQEEGSPDPQFQDPPMSSSRDGKAPEPTAGSSSSRRTSDSPTDHDSRSTGDASDLHA